MHVPAFNEAIEFLLIASAIRRYYALSIPLRSHHTPAPLNPRRHTTSVKKEIKTPHLPMIQLDILNYTLLDTMISNLLTLLDT